MRKIKQSLKKDEGAALALVLVMVVLLSLWLMSVSILTQSSNAAINQNLVKTAQKNSAVSIAIQRVVYCAQVLSDNNNNFNYPGCVKRPDPTTNLLNQYLVGSGSNPCSTPEGFVSDIDFSYGSLKENAPQIDLSKLGSYYFAKDEGQSGQMYRSDYTDYPLMNVADWVPEDEDSISPFKTLNIDTNSIPVTSGTLRIACKNLASSGVVNPLASYMLVGTSLSGEIGRESGLKILACSTNNNSFDIAGGLFNSSGLWDIGSNCGRVIQLTNSVGNLNQIQTVKGGCAAITNKYGPNDVQTINEVVFRTCDESLLPEEMDLAFKNSKIAAYVQYQNSLVPTPTSPASFSSRTCRVSNGIIDITVWNSIKSSLNSSSSSACGRNASNPIYLGTSNKFDSFTPFVFEIPAGKFVVSANYIVSNSISGCSSNPGSQLLFSGKTSISIKGTLYLCPVNSDTKNAFGQVVDKPVISTCNFFWGRTCGLDDFSSQYAVPFLDIASGGNLTAKGPVFAPNGWGNISQLSGAIFQKGILLKALTLDPTSKLPADSTSPVASKCNGDRCLELTITFTPTGGSTITYGVIQIRMRDNFLGYRKDSTNISNTSGKYIIDYWNLRSDQNG